jgi:hypothetical protein
MNKLTRKRWIYNLIPLLIWFLLLVLPYLSGPANIPPYIHHRFMMHVLVNNTLLLCIFYTHTYLLYPLIKQYGLPWYLAALLILLGTYWCYWFVFAIPPHMPPYNGSYPRHHDFPPPPHFNNGWNGALPRNVASALGPLIAILCSFCYRIILNNASREQQLKDRENIHLQTELNFLRSQVSPHFLFNVLNNLVSLSRKRSDKLEPALVNLSHLLRYMIYESDHDKVLLDREVTYIDSYINLQMLRFGNEVTVRINVDGPVEKYMIEPMLLIPFIENAFKHGTGLVDHPVILISLEVNDEKKQLFFKVVNTVNALDSSKDKNSGIGLNNVIRRLDILYPGNYQLNIIDKNHHFTTELAIHLG